MEIVKYNEDSLVITIPTNSPAATHHLLMKGIIASLRQNITAEGESDVDGLIVLADVLLCVLPKEMQLQKAI